MAFLSQVASLFIKESNAFTFTRRELSFEVVVELIYLTSDLDFEQKTFRYDRELPTRY